MSLEICVLLILLVSILLNFYLIWRAITARKATKALGLEGAVQLAVFDKAKCCHEQATRVESLDRNMRLRRAERNYKEIAEIASAIGWPVPEDWHQMFETCRPPSRTLGGCSDPTHQQP